MWAYSMGCEGESHFLGMPGGKKESTGVSEDGREDTDDGPSQEVPTGLVCVVVVVIDGAWHWYALVVVCVCGLPPCLLLAGSDSSSSSSRERGRRRRREKRGLWPLSLSLWYRQRGRLSQALLVSLLRSSYVFLPVYGGHGPGQETPRPEERERWVVVVIGGRSLFFFSVSSRKEHPPPSFLSLVPSRTHLDQNKTKSL